MIDEHVCQAIYNNFKNKMMDGGHPYQYIKNLESKNYIVFKPISRMREDIFNQIYNEIVLYKIQVETERDINK